MAGLKLSDAEQKDIAAYAERLVELLDACADHQRVDPEVFLWNTRRALEAIGQILVIAAGVSSQKRDTKAPSEPSLHGTLESLKSRGILDVQQATRFTALREHSNLGVHIRKPERENYATSGTDVQKLLPDALRWFCRESVAAPYLKVRKAQLEDKAMLIELGGRELTRTQQEAEEWHQKYDDLQTVLRQLQHERDAARSALAMVGTGVSPVAPAPPRRSFAGGLLAGTLLGALLIGCAALVGSGMVSALRAGPSVVPPSVPEARAPAPAAAEAAPSAPAPVSTAPPVSPCPDGMVLIGKGKVTLGQPTPRPKWPAARPEVIAPIEVASFCVDPAPRTFAQLRSWERFASAPTESKCTPNAGDGAPATCIRHETARDYCAAMVPEGRLPTVAEWELMARTPMENLAQSILVKEWANDTFPPAVFNRPTKGCKGVPCGGGLYRENPGKAKREEILEASNLMWSWNNQEPQQMWSNLGFRCASPAKGD